MLSSQSLTLKMLQDTRQQLLNHPDSWTTGVYDEESGKHCLIGTLRIQGVRERNYPFALALAGRILRNALPKPFITPETFNDVQGYNAVIALLDRVILQLTESVPTEVNETVTSLSV